MNTTTDTGETPFITTTTTGDTRGTIPDGLKFSLVLLFLVIIICYGSYISKCGMRSRSPPPQSNNTTISFNTNTTAINDENHHIKVSQGLNDDVLVTFPTFVYSEFAMMHKGDANFNVPAGCSICLEDYKPADVVRSLPECEHLFHLSCVDSWLKVHPTCPVCRSCCMLSSSH